MQIKIYRTLVGLMVMGLPLAALAQNSSLNTFSPYTFYGIGEIHPVGTSATRSMGGIGAAYINPYEVNLVNPAAFSYARPQSATMTVGIAGRSSYLRTNEAKTANNAFNFNDFGLMLPLGRRAGFAVSVTPYSSVGYETEIEQHKQPGEDPNLIVDVGHILHSFSGEGNISQVKAGVGIQLFDGFSFGANFITYLGSISRYTSTVITPVNAESYRNMMSTRKDEIADISFELGMMYTFWKTQKRALTFGASFQPEVSLKYRYRESTITYDASNSYVVSEYTVKRKMHLPMKIVGGFYYQTARFGAGLDYSYQDWSNSMKVGTNYDRMSMKESHNIHAGVHYTPNRTDIRRFLNRWTYRAGFRYTTLPMVNDGQEIDETAFSVGLGIPIRSSSPSEMSVGFEFGWRGKRGITPNGYPLVQDRFFRVSLGFSLFDNSWFMKYKYD